MCPTADKIVSYSLDLILEWTIIHLFIYCLNDGQSIHPVWIT